MWKQISVKPDAYLEKIMNKVWLYILSQWKQIGNVRSFVWLKTNRSSCEWWSLILVRSVGEFIKKWELVFKTVAPRRPAEALPPSLEAPAAATGLPRSGLHLPACRAPAAILCGGGRSIGGGAVAAGAVWAARSEPRRVSSKPGESPWAGGGRGVSVPGCAVPRGGCKAAFLPCQRSWECAQWQTHHRHMCMHVHRAYFPTFSGDYHYFYLFFLLFIFHCSLHRCAELGTFENWRFVCI